MKMQATDINYTQANNLERKLMLQIVKTEPRFSAWVDTETGYACACVRNNAGAWCGYVWVDAGHPDFGKDEGQIEANVHGGVTLSEATEDRWLFGFDADHSGDMSPSYLSKAWETPVRFSKMVYRQFWQVKEQVGVLARYLKDRE